MNTIKNFYHLSPSGLSKQKRTCLFFHHWSKWIVEDIEIIRDGQGNRFRVIKEYKMCYDCGETANRTTKTPRIYLNT